jgi:predicted RNA polymerase sigma factor
VTLVIPVPGLRGLSFWNGSGWPGRTVIGPSAVWYSVLTRSLMLSSTQSLTRRFLLPAVAGELLCRTGEHGRARKDFLKAASLTSNTQERATMQRRAAECAVAHVPEL